MRIFRTRVSKKEESVLVSYIETSSPEKWIESSFDAEGPLYWMTMSIHLHSASTWHKHRLTHLKRMIVLAQARHSQPSGPIKSLSNKNEEDYNVYKPYLIFFGIIDGIYKNFFKNVAGTDEQWPSNLADYIRHNDEALMKASERLLGIYTDELLPCTSFAEFCDVAGMILMDFKGLSLDDDIVVFRCRIIRCYNNSGHLHRRRAERDVEHRF